AGANGLPLQNFILKPKGDTLVKHDIYFWLDGQPRVVGGQISGNVEYLGQMHGDGILDRDVIVLLPNDYESNTEKQYPVLYMHDGQNLFDPTTSSFGVDWQIDETLDSLSKLGTVEIPIVVGIYNTNERTADYTIGKQSQDYMRFVVETVKPFIDKKYCTLTDAKNTAVGGSSYGGLISFKMAWEYPHIFSKAFCLSPAFKVQNIDYVQNVLDYKGERKNLTFYIDNGGIGLEEQLQPGIDDMLEALEVRGYKKDKDFFYITDKKARHFESDWAKRMPNAFLLMYKLNSN
ncbi:MAG: histidine kinase, partial [Bacteroidetes bacterium]